MNVSQSMIRSETIMSQKFKPELSESLEVILISSRRAVPNNPDLLIYLTDFSNFS